MKPLEFTLSLDTTDALRRAFMPYGTVRVGGEPLSIALRRKRRAGAPAMPPDLQLKLAHTLEQVLLLEGGAEGPAILEALDGVIHEGGAPAVLIHGLPETEGGGLGIAGIVAEAFRQRMYPAASHARTHELIQDSPTLCEEDGITKDGVTHLHHDRGDVVLLYGLKTGQPRHTGLFDARGLAEHLVALTARNPHYAGLTDQKRTWLADDYLKLLRLPIWRADHISGAEEAQALAKSQGLLRHDDENAYTPILYPNPQYDPQVPGSCPDRFIKLPFANILARLWECDTAELPPALVPALGALREALQQALHQPYDAMQGPVVKTGDLLVFSNALLMHAGGPHTKDYERIATLNAPMRSIGATDSNYAGRPQDYPVQPGDWREVIVPENPEPRTR